MKDPIPLRVERSDGSKSGRVVEQLRLPGAVLLWWARRASVAASS